MKWILHEVDIAYGPIMPIHIEVGETNIFLPLCHRASGESSAPSPCLGPSCLLSTLRSPLCCLQAPGTGGVARDDGRRGCLSVVVGGDGEGEGWGEEEKEGEIRSGCGLLRVLTEGSYHKGIYSEKPVVQISQRKLTYVCESFVEKSFTDDSDIILFQ